MVIYANKSIIQHRKSVQGFKRGGAVRGAWKMRPGPVLVRNRLQDGPGFFYAKPMEVEDFVEMLYDKTGLRENERK